MISMNTDKGDFRYRNAGIDYAQVLATVSRHLQPLLYEMASFAKVALEQTDGDFHDVGCGTGASTEALLDIAPCAKVIASDVSAEMISSVSAHLRADKRVSWRTVDMITLLKEAPDSSLRGISNGFALHNLSREERAEFFALLPQKLKLGAVFTTADKIAVDDTHVHQEMLQKRIREYQSLAALGFPENADRWVEHYRIDETRRFTMSELCTHLGCAGFQNLQFGTRNGLYAVVAATYGISRT